MSSLLRVFRTLAQVSTLALIVFCVPTQAAPVLQVDATSGKLTGAVGVEVAGASYDVSFQDGTCLGLAIAGCVPATNFVFGTSTAALAASQALVDSVLIDVGPGQLFDSIPELTRGCEFLGVCEIATPYGFSFGFLLAAIASNQVVNSSDSAYLQLSTDTVTDLTTYDSLVWAIWTPRSPTTAVSEPASLPLLAAAGLALIATIRRRQSRLGMHN